MQVLITDAFHENEFKGKDKHVFFMTVSELFLASFNLITVLINTKSV